jgi:hypothetical protein
MDRFYHHVLDELLSMSLNKGDGQTWIKDIIDNREYTRNLNGSGWGEIGDLLIIATQALDDSGKREWSQISGSEWEAAS